MLSLPTYNSFTWWVVGGKNVMVGSCEYIFLPLTTRHVDELWHKLCHLYGPNITSCNICMHIYILHDHIITNVEIYQNNVKLWGFFYNYFPPKILKSQISFKTQKFWQNSAKFIFLITHIKKHEIFKMHNFS